MSKNWREVYKDKIVTADEAVKQIKSGDRLIFSHACGEAQEITDALLRNKESYEKVEIIHLVPMGKGEYAQEENQKYFYHNSFLEEGVPEKPSMVLMEILRHLFSLKFQIYLEKMENCH